MHTSFPLTFAILQYSEFATRHVNSIIRMDIPHKAFGISRFPVKTWHICRYYSCFRSFIWTCIRCSLNMCLSRGSYSSLQHTALCLFTAYVSFVHCKQTSQQFAKPAGDDKGSPREELCCSLKRKQILP